MPVLRRMLWSLPVAAGCSLVIYLVPGNLGWLLGSLIVALNLLGYAEGLCRR